MNYFWMIKEKAQDNMEKCTQHTLFSKEKLSLFLFSLKKTVKNTKIEKN